LAAFPSKDLRVFTDRIGVRQARSVIPGLRIHDLQLHIVE